MAGQGSIVDDLTSWWARWWVKAILYAALAAFGGFLGHVMRALDNSADISYGRACVEGLAAGFVGLLVMLVCNAIGFSDQWTGVIVGVSGWLGANASIRMLEKLVFKKLGLTTGSSVSAQLDENPSKEKSDA
jgi:hypothetical protein